jgi:hypothetical protein
MDTKELYLDEMTVEEQTLTDGGKTGDLMWLAGWSVGFNLRAIEWGLDQLF